MITLNLNNRKKEEKTAHCNNILCQREKTTQNKYESKKS